MTTEPGQKWMPAAGTGGPYMFCKGCGRTAYYRRNSDKCRECEEDEDR